MTSLKSCLFFLTIQLIWLISAQEQEKRIPQGFVGMRGKKMIDFNEIEQYYRPKPQFFIGVKGKKYDALQNDPISYKRTPVGFVGMRGKKGYDADLLPFLNYMPRTGSLIGQIEYSTEEDQNQFQNGDFPHLNYLLNEYWDKTKQQDSRSAVLNTNWVDKRAASNNQFFGVRGKKSIENKRPYDLTFRGKFIGVRGKKDTRTAVNRETSFLSGDDEPWHKRKAQMGFFGMRGKKWADDESSPETAALLK